MIANTHALSFSLSCLSRAARRWGWNSVPFHKLSQWMTYSLMEPLQKVLGVEIEGVEQMTGERRLSAISFPFFSPPFFYFWFVVWLQFANSKVRAWGGLVAFGRLGLPEYRNGEPNTIHSIARSPHI
jgi:hypothetical protein